MTTPNVAAFQATVRHSEGTARAADPYRVVYSFAYTIKDLRDHPAVTGEWKGARLPDDMCIKAGREPPCFSTAAGAYQIIKPTWLALKSLLHLNNFGPQSQDDACVQLIKEHGALDLVNRGEFADAIAKCSGIWASLPFSTAGQPVKSLASLLQVYTGAGGLLA